MLFKDIENNDKKELLKIAMCRYCKVSSSLLNGKRMVVFEETIVVMRNVFDYIYYLYWKDFIYTHHYSVFDDFFDSSLGKFPRRTCELIFDNTQRNRWIHCNRGFKKGMSFEELKSYLKDLLHNEIEGKEILNNPYI